MGGQGYWGRACRQKGPARATKYFSGNGVAVAAMCAALHQHGTRTDVTGGGLSDLSIAPKKGPNVRLMVGFVKTNVPKKKPHKHVSACEA